MAAPLLLAGGRAFLQRLVSGPLAGAIAFAPTVIQAAGELNSADGDPGGDLAGFVGSLALGAPGLAAGGLVGRALSGGAVRGAAKLSGRTLAGTSPTLRRAKQIGGLTGGALGAMGLAGVGAGLGRAVAGLGSDPFDEQIKRQARMFDLETELQNKRAEAMLPVQRLQMQAAREDAKERAMLASELRGLEIYRQALLGAAQPMPGAYSDPSFNQMLAGVVQGAMS